MKVSLCVLLAVLLIFAVVFVRAQDADAPIENAENVEVSDTDAQTETESVSGFLSSPDVSPAWVLPEHADKKIPAGKIIDILLGFANKGEKNFKVEYIRGFLVSPLDWTYFIQNFTGFAYNVTVRAGEENSLFYRFRTDPNLDPREFGILIDVYYTSEDNETFVTSFFNETVTIVEPIEGLDTRSFFAYLSMIGMFSLAGFGIYKALQQSKYKNKLPTFGAEVEKTVKPEDAKKSSIEDDSWIPDHVKQLSKKSKQKQS